eukprot:SAG31_NODE_6717_length_1912_cov_29.734694_2_plen_101_part_00
MVNNQKISHRSSDSTEEIGRRGSSGHCRGGDCIHERHQREGQRGLEVGQTTQVGGGGGALSSVSSRRGKTRSNKARNRPAKVPLAPPKVGIQDVTQFKKY